jgi:hypothetical protein
MSAVRIMVIREHSPLRVCWDMLILVLIVLSCLLIPYQLVFLQSTDQVDTGLMQVIGLVFLCDMGLNFYTSYREAGAEILETKAIRRHYLSGLFVFDLLANFPLAWLVAAGDPQVGGFSLVLLVRLLALLRLVRFFAILRRMESLNWTHPGYLRMIKYVGVVLLLAHCIACIWFASAYIDQFPADSWVVAADIQDSEPFSQYIRSLYWTITTMTTVGYGDITPNRTVEYILACIIMLLGASLYAFIIGGLASLLGNLHAARNSHWEHMESVEQYLRSRHVPAALGTRVHNYYEYLWERHKGLRDSELFRDLPDSLRLDIMLHLTRDVLQQVPLFQHCSPFLRNTLLVALEPATCAPGNYLTREGQLGKSIVFITVGRVEILVGEKQTSYGELGPGDYYGHLTLALGEHRTASVRACDYCEVFILNKPSYDEISIEYPEFVAVMKKVSAQRSERTSALLLEGVVL